MKRLHFIIVALLLSMAVYSQNAAQARKILDKTAAVVGRKGGASADFSISGKHANASGTISIRVISLTRAPRRLSYGMTERHNGHI